MDSPTIFAVLRDALATLYPERADARLIATDAGLDLTTIAFNDRAQTNWHNILAAALNQNRLDALLQVVHTAYPANPPFQAAYTQYTRFLDQGGHLTPPPTIDTAGGTYIAGNATTDTGDLIARDQHIAGDKVSGDKIGGDKVSGNKTTTINIGALKIPISLVLIISICLIAVAGVITYPLVAQWLPAPLAFARQATGETLIVIATFHNTAATNTEPHIKIRRAIAAEITNNNEQQVRVETEPTVLTADQQTEAAALGRRYNASMVIWGEDTGVELIVNFLNLRETNVSAASTTIRETERTQLANPSAYASFITNDLPQTINFFVFFAIGQSYYLNNQYTLATARIETAITKLRPDTTPQGLAEAYFRLGWLYQVPTPNNLNQAIANYDQAIAINPDDAVAYNNRGFALSHQGQLDAAIADYNKAITINPDYAFVYTNRGIALSDQGQLDAAIADYNKAITNNPDDALAYIARGSALYSQGKLDAAIADYNKAIAINPDYENAYNGRGNALKARGKLDDAIADYTQAITINPDYENAYNGRGSALSAQGKLDAAIADYNKAIAINPDSDYAFAYYTNRGIALSNQGKLDAAIADFTKAIAINPDYEDAYYNRGSVRFTQGKFGDAIADYTKAIDLDPNNAINYNGRGSARYAEGKFDDAIADYTKAIDLDPNNAINYNNRGSALYSQGKLDDAIADYTTAIDLNPDFANAYSNRGNALSDQGKLDAAIADFTKVIALNPDFALAYSNRGFALKAQGKLDAAIADYTKAIDLDPDFALAYNNICWTYALVQQPILAMPNCHRAIELDPQPAYYDSRGLGYALLQDFPAAIADFQTFVDFLESVDDPAWTKYVEKRKTWIAELKAGRNPFTPEVLEALQQE